MSWAFVVVGIATFNILSLSFLMGLWARDLNTVYLSRMPEPLVVKGPPPGKWDCHPFSKLCVQGKPDTLRYEYSVGNCQVWYFDAAEFLRSRKDSIVMWAVFEELRTFPRFEQKEEERLMVRLTPKEEG